MTNAFGEAATADYVMLTTFRKDGSPVGTPLWAVADEGKLYMWTVTDSWKVKRIKRNATVTVQACDARGKKLSGQPVDGTARVLDAAGTDHVRSLLKRKYKLLAWVTLLGSNLRRGKDGTVGLEIRPAA